MLAKIIFGLAVICVVNASVITINVFEDDPKTDVSNVKSCNPQACDQLCRRLKFPGGACVNGRCKCDNFLQTKDVVLEKSLTDIENLVSLREDDPESEANFKSCNPQACDQLCRRLKFPGGACVNGRCKCDNFLQTKDVVLEKSLSDIEDLVSLREFDPESEANVKSCNPQACDQLCRRLKFPGGACVNGRCKCDNFLQSKDSNVVLEKSLSDIENLVSLRDNDSESDANLKDCNPQACDQLCRRLKFPGGACVNGRCKCDNFLQTKEVLLEKSLYDIEDLVSLRDGPKSEANLKSCSPQACDQLCRRLKFPGGACVNGRCKCDLFLHAEVLDESLSNPEDSVRPKTCINEDCIELCRKLKMHGGTCSGDVCVCNLSPLEDGLEIEVPVSPKSCNLRACEQLCHRLGFPGGVCVNGRCKCDNFLNIKDEIAEMLANIEDSFSTRRCTPEVCNLLCRKLKYEEGVCTPSRCRCKNNTTLQEESLADCNSIACDDQCRRNGWDSGASIHGQCKCNYFLNKEESLIDCDSIACDDQCRRNGWDSGACIHGQCKCNYFLNNEESLSDCDSIACDDQCRRNGWDSGACINGQCKCNYFLNSKDAVDEYSEITPRRHCWLRKCNRTCTRLGYKNAKCVNGVCKCYNKTQTESLSDCDSIACDDQCRRNGWDSGACIHGQCKCNYFLNNEEPLISNEVTNDDQDDSKLIVRTDKEELIVPSLRACNTVTCDQMCRRLKYARGMSRGHVCQCY